MSHLKRHAACTPWDLIDLVGVRAAQQRVAKRADAGFVFPKCRLHCCLSCWGNRKGTVGWMRDEGRVDKARIRQGNRRGDTGPVRPRGRTRKRGKTVARGTKNLDSVRDGKAVVDVIRFYMYSVYTQGMGVPLPSFGFCFLPTLFELPRPLHTRFPSIPVPSQKSIELGKVGPRG